MTRTTLLVRYAAFAAIATVANLAVQRLVLLAGSGLGLLLLAIASGTLVGLVIKYLLDKRWIFQDFEANHTRKFALYSLMGVITTAIFWGSELLFWWIWGTDLMREIGAVLGLTIGYGVKYWLDRRFVFTDAQLERT